MADIHIRQMRPGDIGAVVDLHRQVLGNTFNARVGKMYLARLYQVLLYHDPVSAGWVAVGGDCRIAGFLSVTRDLSGLDRTIRKRIGFAAWLMIFRHLMAHPADIGKIYGRMTFSRHLEVCYGKIYPTILTIGVDSSAQKSGIGRKLIETADIFFRSNGVANYFVDTEAANRNAIDFYMRRAFTVLEEFGGNVIFRKETG